MITKKVTLPLLFLLPLFTVLILLGTLHTPTINAAPDGTQTVTTLADSGTGSLRQAIADATAGDSIEFSVNGTIVLASQLVVDKNLTINGGNLITVSGNNVTRVFKVTNGTVVFDSLTIANGSDFQTHDCWGDACGGGLLIQSGDVSVMLTNSTLSDNATHIYGGGIANLSVLTITDSTLADNVGMNGGGLYNYGTVIINDTDILSNSANYYGGGIYHHHGMITINNSNISDNWANASSGAIYNYDEMVLNNTTVSHNLSDGHGGGIVNSGQSPNLGVLVINDSHIIDNAATYGGGIVNLADMTISNGTISNNSVLFYGGGIYNNGTMTITHNIFSGNSVNDGGGGGIYNYNGVMEIGNSAVSGNSATDGGGIYNHGSTGMVTMSNSTLSNNSAKLGSGGGLYNVQGVVTINDSTFSGNTAEYGGGGIYNEGVITLNSNTITDNRVKQEAGGGINSYSGVEIRTIVTNTIISGNTLSGTTTANDLNLFNGHIDSFVSGGHNLIGTIESDITAFADGVNGDQTAVNNPKLFPLANNSGSTLTHALQLDSPALDAGANCGATDQCGVARPQGEACDIGAYEYKAPIVYTDFVFLPIVVK